MVLVKCECGSVHESKLPVCPGCGRCPCCGVRRVAKRELAQQSACSICGVPYCSGCGRCHVCGAVRFSEMEPHTCGFPTDPDKVRTVEESFGLQRRMAGGCLFFLIAVVFVGFSCLAFVRRPQPELSLQRTPAAAASFVFSWLALGPP